MMACRDPVVSDADQNNRPFVFSHGLSPLQKASFSANIAYGFKGEDKPGGLITIVRGKVTNDSAYAGESLDWNLPASPVNWQLWLKEGFGLSRLGPAIAMK